MKRRARPRIEIFDLGQGQTDAIVFDPNGKTMVIESKLGSGKTNTYALLLGYYRALNLVLTDPPFKSHASIANFIQDPPRLAEFLLSLVPLKYRENLLGDLEEEYRTRLLPRHGLRKAQLYYCVQALFSIAAFLARPLVGIFGNHWIGKIVEYVETKLLSGK